MVDETGVPGAPYVGKRGPRKTKPQKKKDPTVAAASEELFSEERKAADHSVNPFDGVKKKGRKRKRVMMGAGWTAALDRMEDEGMTMQEFVKTLSPEELARGQLRGANGTFVGAPPKWVPAEFHKECIRELMRQGKELYQINYIQAIESMTHIANSPAVEPAQRIKAAQFVIERIEGKVPERLEVGVSEPWQELLTGIVASVEPGALPTRALHETEDGDGVEA